MSDDTAFDLHNTYVHFTDGGSAEKLAVTEQFWPDLVSGKLHLGGRLITVVHMKSDWPHWEMHPKGEELVVLLSGAIELIVERDGRELRQKLERPGQAWLNLRGDWHRAIVHTPGDMLFVTHGEGTEHRPVEA
ncbi:MAG TPA: hypothetical protein PKA88_03450 [Polyangiaceae bacterium]|nr:hypothetical protein [Polyangiaceae bacterium]HMR80067.1 hypothetical protein [Polyangiaceae bacterium]